MPGEPEGTMPTGSTGMMGNEPSGMGGQTNRNRMQHAWREGSPEEVRDEMRRMVEKGVAAVTGAIRGFTTRVKEDDLPGQAGEAVREAGRTAQSFVKQTGEQARQMREPMKQTTHEMGASAREMGRSMSKEARETGSTLGEETRRLKDTAKQQKAKWKGGGSESTSGSETGAGSQSDIGSERM